jgi:hypothetical protein
LTWPFVPLDDLQVETRGRRLGGGLRGRLVAASVWR